MFHLLPQCWQHSFASLSFFFATSFQFFACRILASSRYLEFLLQYNSVLKRLDQPPLLKIFFFKNLAKKGILQLQLEPCLCQPILDYGRHVARLGRRRQSAKTADWLEHNDVNGLFCITAPVPKGDRRENSKQLQTTNETARLVHKQIISYNKKSQPEELKARLLYFKSKDVDWL